MTSREYVYLALGLTAWIAVAFFASDAAIVPVAYVYTGSQAWEPLNEPIVWLGEGVRYRAAVDVPWYASAFATPEKARAYAESRGFTDVAVSNALPSGWPIVKGDLFVEATWSQAGQRFDRPSAITAAWALLGDSHAA